MTALISYFILVYCDLMQSVLATTTTMEHEYRIKEEIPLGTTVGNLIDDVLVRQLQFGLFKPSASVSQKPDHVRPTVTFKVLNYAERGVNCFKVKSDGNLVTARRIDREQLCANRPVKDPNGVYGMVGHSGDSSILHSSGNSNKLYDSDSHFCPVTIHCTVQPQSHKSTTSHSSQQPTGAVQEEEQILIQIHILIEDINDNPPYWPGHLQHFQVHFRDGDPIGERRTLPPAVDNDIGVNARLRYELVSMSSGSDHQIPFSLMENPIDGLYLYATKQIDREEQSSYQVSLKVTDGVTSSDQIIPQGHEGLTQHSAKLVIDVLIEDINDNPPVFTQPIFTPPHPIPETIPVGKTILMLNATDADADLNGAFHFGFSREHAWLPAERLAREYFEVRPNGHVVVRRPLNVDRPFGRWEVRQGAESIMDLDRPMSTNSLSSTPGLGNEMQFRFRVVVEDEAVRPYTKSSEATVVIIVRDENDEAPVIQVKPYLSGPLTHSIPMGLRLESGRLGYLLVEENQPPGTKLATIQVYDPDFDGTDSVECRLRTVNFTLSRNTDSMDGGASSSSGGLMVYNLHTSIEIDREMTPSQHIPILCSDMAGHYTEQNVTVHVTDVNDNHPQFVQTEFAFQVEENAPPGTPLRRIPLRQNLVPGTSMSSQFQTGTEQSVRNGLWNLLATDLDSGQNSEIQYLLRDNGPNSTGFTVDPVTGALTTSIVFDREVTDQYTVEALAVDRGNPPLTGSVMVKITIDDVNDNPPKFIQSEYSFHIAENQPRSTQIGQVGATDLDSEIHGPITYFLSTDRDALAFRLDRDSGVLRSRQPLDREEQSRYVFRVLARDGSPTAGTTGSRSSSDRPISVGLIQLTGTTTVTVIVDDVNDNWPVFISPNATANTLAIAVDETLGHKLAYIQAEDADQDENGLISYHIRSGNNQRLFGLDSATGLLYLAGNLGQATTGVPQRDTSEKNGTGDHVDLSAKVYTPSFHMLTLEACDHGHNPKPLCTLFSNLKIIIKNPKEDEFDVYSKRTPVVSVADSRETEESKLFGLASPGIGGRIIQSGSLDYGNQMSLANNLHLGRPRHNASEILIICLSVVFTVILMATLVLICLLRKRSANYLARKKIRTEGDHESRNHDWNEVYSPTQLEVEAKQATDAEPEVTESQSNIQFSEAKLHEHDLSTYPRPVESPTFVPANLSKDQYHLLTRTVDTRRRNMPRDLQSQEPLVDSRSLLRTGDCRFPTVAGSGRILSRQQMSKPPRNNSMDHSEVEFDVDFGENRSENAGKPSYFYQENEYQTLDYLGLVSSAIPQRCPNIYATQRRLTYSPLGPSPIRMYHGAVFSGIRPQKSDAFLLTHMNQLSGNSVKSPLPDYKGSDPNYPVNHSHSRSQPQPMDRRSVEYPFVGPSSVPVCVQPNLAPTINHPIRPGLPNLQQTAVYQSLANSNANMISSCGSGSTTLYGSRTKPYPIQSHTYYDIRQSDQSGDVNLMHKSKSQQITLRDSKPSPHNTSMTEDEVSADQASNDFAVINPTSIGTAQINDSIFKNRSNEACWRELASDTRSKEWNMPSEQPNINVSESLPRFMLSPVDSPKYIAAAYKEASFV